MTVRKFFSYGPVSTKLHYYVPRQELIEQALGQLMGEEPEGGHCITVWAPRQAGKTWIMQHVLYKLRHDAQCEQVDALKVNLEHLKMTRDVDRIAHVIAKEIIQDLGLEGVSVNTLDEFYNVFERGVLKKPLVLIMDEFDALVQDAISGIASVFRNIYNRRRDELEKSAGEKTY